MSLALLDPRIQQHSCWHWAVTLHKQEPYKYDELFSFSGEVDNCCCKEQKCTKISKSKDHHNTEFSVVEGGSWCSFVNSHSMANYRLATSYAK